MQIASAPTVSIIVCTHNRADELERTCLKLLKAIERFPAGELLIVDNGSTDRTQDLLTDLSSQDPDHIRSIREPRPGLSTARNTGLTHTSGEVVIFIDDDAVPDSGWLDAMVTEFSDPSVWAVGGPVTPKVSSEFPDWFSARFLPYLSAWEPSSEGQDLSYNEYPRGTNMAFSRRVFTELGSFLPQLGRRGSSLRSCEETELCLRVERAGYRIRYQPDARVVHRVEVKRLTQSWMVDRFFAQGFSEAILEWRHGGFNALRLGLKRGSSTARQIRLTTNSTSRFLQTCHGGARRGYLAGSIYAPLRVPRYTPNQSGQPSTAWIPPH